MKKINFKQPKYIFPAIIFLPIVALSYQLTSLFSGTGKDEGVVTDSINMSLPEADNDGLKDKMAEMDNRFLEDGAYSAIDNIGEDAPEAKDSISAGYSEEEMNRIDEEKAARQQQEKEAEALNRSLANSRRNVNRHSDDDFSQNSEIQSYLNKLDEIRNGSSNKRKRSSRFSNNENDNEYNDDYEDFQSEDNSYKKKTKRIKKEKKEVVVKAPDQNKDRFNTISQDKNSDDVLIKAIIDQTIKAKEGTRLRFKLLDDVLIKNIKIKKGTYLYGLVTGFSSQRVMAKITSI